MNQRSTTMRILQTFVLGLLLAAGLAHGQGAPRIQGTITTQNLVATGACTSGGCVEIDVTNKGAVGVEVTGTYTGALSVQTTTDGSTWKTLAPTPFTPATATGTPTATISSGATGQWQVSVMVPGSLKLRITALAAVSGTATVTLNASPVAPGGSGGGGAGTADSTAAKQDEQTALLTTIDSDTSRLTSSAGPNTAGAALSTTAFQIGGRYLTTPATMTDGQEAGITLTTDQQLRARATVASGGVASGAFASGSIASGAMVDLGAQADAACATDNGTCSQIALQKRTNQRLTTLDTSVNAPNTELTAPQTPVAPATATATKGQLGGCQYDSAGVTMTNGQQGRVGCTGAGSVDVAAATRTDVLQTLAGNVTPKFARFSVSSSGNNAIVALVASKKIRVVAFLISPSAAVNAKFQSDGGGTPVDISGLFYMGGAGNGVSGSYSPLGHFESGSGKSLDLNLSGAVTVSGHIVYVEI